MASIALAIAAMGAFLCWQFVCSRDAVGAAEFIDIAQAQGYLVVDSTGSSSLDGVYWSAAVMPDTQNFQIDVYQFSDRKSAQRAVKRFSGLLDGLGKGLGAKIRKSMHGLCVDSASDYCYVYHADSVVITVLVRADDSDKVKSLFAKAGVKWQE